MKKEKAGKLPADTRCPRCKGFLFDAIHHSSGHTEYILREKAFCLNCARFWVLQDNRLAQWPARNGEKEEKIK